MNRFLHHPLTRLFLVVLLLLVTVYVIQREHVQSVDSFEDTVEPSPEELDAANTNYAALLLFLKKYPSRSIPFIKDMKNKLYGDSCTVKPSIDFESIATFPNGMVFV